MLCSLTLHHFSNEQLRQLGHRLKNARLLLISEPARRRRHLWQGKCLHLLGLNRVTRHDMPVSIRAGFLQDELPAALGLAADRWKWAVSHTFFGAYRLIATRLPS